MYIWNYCRKIWKKKNQIDIQLPIILLKYNCWKNLEKSKILSWK